MKPLFVELGMGSDLHGQNVTRAAVRACRDAIERNSLPGLAALLPGGDRSQVQIEVTLGVPEVPGATPLDEAQVLAVFPFGRVSLRRMPGGLVAAGGSVIAEMGDRSDAIVVVVAAVAVGLPD